MSEYRVMIGEDGDDYIYQGNLSWDAALMVSREVKSWLKPGAYVRIEQEEET